ncbi:MAG: alpha/beta hydrolase [Acidobacteria bacterium]|nr:alpha/beta hydrolase [Acidobacteriota bacterium]
MAFVELEKSLFSQNSQPIKLYYREYGKGFPLVFLHSGWGYEFYHFIEQVKLLEEDFRILIPDRAGYGRSTSLDYLPSNFHRLAALDMLEFLDKLAIERAFLWGHSDGAVIAAIMGLIAPLRVSGLILEAFHFFRAKTKSVEFFQMMVNSPDEFGEKVTQILAKDHSTNWRKVLENGGRAWLEIISKADNLEEDFYFQRLSELAPPTIFIHGEKDLRTEIGEMEEVKALLPQAEFQFLSDIGHSPHTSTKGSKKCNQLVLEFLRKIKKTKI